MAVNVRREKKLTKIRSSTKKHRVRLTPATKLSLEQCLDFLVDDELLEVTPAHCDCRRYLTELYQAQAAAARPRLAAVYRLTFGVNRFSSAVVHGGRGFWSRGY